jgi:demethylmenaquinone methyltransferase / 2-methoxy-6-polyprenyl-1,4-benzoquinol methylase
MNERDQAVQRLFARIARHYDRINSLISLGLHRGWRRAALAQVPPEPTGVCLDLCAGTGDFALSLQERGWTVVACDLTPEMLRIARRRSAGSLSAVVGNALALPLGDQSVSLVTNGFGLRQCEEELPTLLAEVRRVLRPGGVFVVLELSHPPAGWWQRLSHLYIHLLIPLVGSLVDRQAYSYLARSLHDYPDADGLRQLLLEAGFRSCDYRLLTGGVAAVHVARL